MMYRKMRTAFFKGLNTKPYAEDGEIREMKNLSDRYYPYLSSGLPVCEYSFDVSVPGRLKDGYDGEAVGELPGASEEYEGQIYKLIPNDNTYQTGEYYYYTGTMWIKGIKNSKFKGYTDDLPNYAVGTVHITERDGDEPYDTIHKRDGEIYKCGSTLKKYCITSEQFIFTKVTDTDRDVSTQYLDWRREFGRKEYIGKILYVYGRYISDSEKGYYLITYECTVSWEDETDYSYSLESSMPENPESNTQYRFIGENTPENGETYICERDYSGENAVYFLRCTDENTAGAEEISSFQGIATEENYKKRYIYTGTGSAGYNIWAETLAPYIKTITHQPQKVH